MRNKHSWLSCAVLALALVPAAAMAEKVATADKTAKPSAPESLDVDTIVKRHIAALGGEKLLRAGKSITFTISGEKMGQPFTKTVYQARPNLMRVDIQGPDGAVSKGFDGKVAWYRKGTAAAEKMDAAGTASMKSHASFDEPLLDYAKKGMKVKLAGMSEVAGAAAYNLEVTQASGEVEHHLLDARTFLLVERSFTVKEKDGKEKPMTIRFGDYKSVQGRMVNHSVTYQGEDGKFHKSAVSKIVFDKPIARKLFAMPK